MRSQSPNKQFAARAIVAWTTSLVVLCGVASCGGLENGMPISNEQIKAHSFLECMYSDDYFPKNLVDKGKLILVRLSEHIEKERPADLTALYVLSHAATDDFNELAEEFYEADSEIETAARECIAADFAFIAEAYGFGNADVEELIATRDW